MNTRVLVPEEGSNGHAVTVPSLQTPNRNIPHHQYHRRVLQSNETPPPRSGARFGRARSSSWPGEAELVVTPSRPLEGWNVLRNETKSVVIWTLLSVGMSGSLNQLVLNKERGTFSTTITGWMLYLLPSKVALNQAPGFCLAPFWLPMILTSVRSHSAETIPSVAHLPTRVAETVLGRIKKQELMIIVLVHWVLTTLIYFALSLLWERGGGGLRSQQMLDPNMILRYSISNSDASSVTWLVDWGREVLVNAALVVAVLVLPVLCTLNSLPAWLPVFALYPLYNFSVHTNNGASTLSPSALVAQLCIQGPTIDALGRVVAQLAGGLLAGRILDVYFPDEQKG